MASNTNEGLVINFLFKNNIKGSELEDLLFRGSFGGWKRCRCPKCSTVRNNKTEKCLAVRYKEGDLYVICHHCGWRSGVTSTGSRSNKLPRGSWSRPRDGSQNGSTKRKFTWL